METNGRLFYLFISETMSMNDESRLITVKIQKKPDLKILSMWMLVSKSISMLKTADCFDSIFGFSLHIFLILTKFRDI